jgi:hypothetical protein
MALPRRKTFTDALHRFQLLRVAAVWLMVFVSGADVVALAKEKHAEEAEALFERARTVSELEVEGGAPFRLEAVIFARVVGGVVGGHYVRVWQSQHRWRDELTLPRYSQVRVDTESAMWRQRNTNHQPLPVVQFLQGLSPGMPLNVPERWKLTIAERKEGSNVMKCVELQHGGEMVVQPVTHEWCFDSGSGALARQIWSDWDTTWEYLEYAPWSGKRYARQINILQGGERVVEAHITVMDAPNPEPATFVPPGDAEEWPRCEKMQLPTAKSLDHSIFPGLREMRKAYISVMLEVGKDGHVQDVVMLRPLADPQREHNLFLDFKQRWKFQPAKCGKVPIPFTYTFEFPI